MQTGSRGVWRDDIAGEVVLLHDWLTGLRGGERVLEAFCEMFPQAPIYTLLHTPGSTSSTIESRRIRTSPMQWLPYVHTKYRAALPVMPVATQFLRIPSDTRLVLSSHHCVIKGVKKPKGAIHISYVHSPMRYIYDQYEHYFGSDAGLATRVVGRMIRRPLTTWDRSSNSNVDLIIANSAFVRERIRRYYKRDALVVHPFVDLSDFEGVRRQPPPKGEHFTMVTAFAPNKRVDLAIAAFERLKLPLVIIGKGQLEAKLRASAGKYVEFLGAVDRETVIDTLARSRALVFPGVEDFGITPLEALAAGTPVIAFRAGGVLETLTESDSVFFDHATVDSLVDAVRRFDSARLTPSFERLSRFSREVFVSKMDEVLRGAFEGQLRTA